jgi:hypothetical protein
MGGKTTAHREGYGLDPEETAAYRVWKSGWGDERVAQDPAWRKVQREAYRKLVRDCIRIGVTPLLIHASEEWARLGIKSGYDVVVAVPKVEEIVPYLRKEARSDLAHVDARIGALLHGIQKTALIAAHFASLVTLKEGYAAVILRDMGVHAGHVDPISWPMEWQDLLMHPYAVWDRINKVVVFNSDPRFQEVLAQETQANPRLKRKEA